jgi:Uncharacterised protein family (UPF0172)
MKQQWLVNDKAYLVAALHFAKHGCGDCVFGLLIGKGREVVEAIPLFHSFVLAPSLILGLSLTTEYAKSLGYEVVGAYSKHILALKYSLAMISPKIKTEPLGLLFDEEQVERDDCMFTGVTDKADVTVDVKCHYHEAHKVLKSLVSEDVYTSLVDLDEHFTDPSKDFLGNSSLVVAK